MKISILCSSQQHPVFAKLEKWVEEWSRRHTVQLVTTSKELEAGDLLFLISCSEIVGPALRARFRSTLIVHASALPQGRGWSPHIWQVIEGAKKIPVSLLEAQDPVDSGAICAQLYFDLEGHELYDEINEKLFVATHQLMELAISKNGDLPATPQQGDASRYYRKRTPEDSRLDPNKTFADQFDLLRVADPERYPNFVDHRGHRYEIRIKKISRAP